MKILFFIYLILNLCSANIGHTFNSLNLTQKLDNLYLLIEKRQNDSNSLFRIKKELSNDLSSLEYCVKKEKAYLLEDEKELALLKNITNDTVGLDLHHKSKANLKKHIDKLYLCQYLILKTNKLIRKIESHNYNVFFKNLFYRDDIINKSFNSLAKLNISQFKGILYNIVAYKTFIRYFIVIITLLCFLFVINLLNQSKRINFLVKKIDQKKLLHTIALYSIIAPAFFLVLHVIYFQKNDILISFYNNKLIYLSVYTYIFGLYQSIKVKSYRKDFLITLPILLLMIFILISSMALLQLKQLINTADQILAIKYLIFIALQPIQISVLYWFFSRVINFNFKNKGIKVVVIFILTGVFVIGLCGYRNFATHINFLIIIDSLYFSLFIIYIKVLKSLFNALNNHKSMFYNFLHKRLPTQTHMAITNIKLLFGTIFLIMLVYTMLAIFTVTFPILTENQLAHIYNFIFGPRLFMSIDYSVNQISGAFILFNSLNLMNIFISIKFAQKIYNDQIKQLKTTKLFIGMGYIVNIILIILILNIHIDNIGLISGAVFLGIGIALQSSLSKIFSSFILYINPPFRVGDYIEINNTRGYVKKISFLETFIETSDNNTIILPNSIISSSTIENYNFENKSFHKIHVNYVLNNLDIQKEEQIKIKLREILKADKNIFEDNHHPIAFIFSLFTQTTDIHHLEIIFCYHTKTNMKQDLTQLNREIAITLKSFNIDAKFESIHFPYD